LDGTALLRLLLILTIGYLFNEIAVVDCPPKAKLIVVGPYWLALGCWG